MKEYSQVPMENRMKHRIIATLTILFLVSGLAVGTAFTAFYAHSTSSNATVEAYPLHAAAIHFPERIDAIVAGGVPPDVLNDAGLTPLQAAVARRKQLGAAKLLALGADPNLGNAAGNSMLAQAAMWGDLETARVLIHFGADVNAEYQTQAALHHAIVHDHTAIVELLLKQPGINLDLPSTATGYTPLHLAVQHERKEIIEQLLARHADPGARDHVGNTPQDLAKHKSDTSFATLLGASQE
jgi:ankyrin repeat protein